jgi:putative membrane protein
MGLLLFTRFLSWLLGRYHDLTVATLIGLMAGSLRKVWPWKETLETIIDRHGKSVPVVERNILPATVEEVAVGVGLAVVGIVIVIALERITGPKQPSDSPIS